MKGLISPSGGLFYHGRALRYRSLWKPFTESLHKWLAAWPTEKNELILVGASAAHTLPTAWLKEFQQVTAFDLDPLAPALFGWNHKGVCYQYHRRDLFRKNGRLSLEPLTELLEAHPQATVLFTNIWGQLLLHNKVSEPEWKRYMSALVSILQMRNWASYHDLYSIESLPWEKHEDVFNRFESVRDIEASLAPAPHSLQVTDHLTNALAPKATHARLMAWTLTPKCLHIVEALRAAPIS